MTDECAPPPEPRARPSKKEFAAGREAVGIIRYSVPNEPPEGGQLDDDLVIHIDTSDDGQPLTLPRTVNCPLPGAGRGRKLIGREVLVRHTTLDASYTNDVLVEEWPAEVTEALKPFRPRGRGAFAYRVWSALWGLGFVVGCGGILLLVPSLCLLVGGLLLGPEMIDNFPAWLQPVMVFPATILAVPLGFWVYVACGHRADEARSRIEGRAT